MPAEFRHPMVAFLVAVSLVCGCAKTEDQRSQAPVSEAREPASSANSPTGSPTASSQDASVPSLNAIFASDATTPDDNSAGPPSLQELRVQRDATVWHLERMAQEYEQAVVQMWDRLLVEQRKGSDGDPYAVFATQSLDTITVADVSTAEKLGWGVVTQTLTNSPRTLSAQQWAEFVHGFRDGGYQIEQTEWHHAKFDVEDEGAARSTITMAIYAVHPEKQTRYVLSGNLLVHWQPREDETALPRIKSVDATQLRLTSRTGPLAFEEILTVNHATPETRAGVQPISVRDFDNDGLSEIVLGGSNELFWNRGQGQFEKDEFLTHPERGFEVSLLADVTGDGICDYVFPGMAGDLLLYPGDASGRFTAPPKGKARGGGPLQQPQVIAAGDIDNDGDVDLWIGQYRISYVGGQMPTPYFDANDGFEAYLLLNDGTGKFSPGTDEAGLGKKRRRRSYGGSFVDLDADSDLDLVVVSDFSGVDVYQNDGRGTFRDITDIAVDDRHLFGMSASFADFNVDGKLDFFVTGMASTTARRLEYMNLGRDDRPEVHEMRSRMGYGNRMYLAGTAPAKFTQPTFRDTVARTGWTWGSTSLDFDNDGRPDIFVANGHSSGESTKDHCSHFWCHDIYDATSQPNREILDVFNASMKGYYDRSESWDGYQKNQLLVNRGDAGFINLGYLLGVGHEYDGRAVISDDLDGDGRLDLLVVEDRWREGQLLHVYRNQFESDNHWIAVRLIDQPGRNSPLGASVILVLEDGSLRTACVTAGDSIHAQHASVVHFGLGDQTRVKSLSVRFPSGDQRQLDAPAVDAYHELTVD